MLEDESSYLRHEDFELEDDDMESDRPEEYWRRTHLDCESCGEVLLFDEEAILITVVHAQNLNGKIECYTRLDDEGDFAYEPIFLHFECWEELEEERRELLRDVPPLRKDATHTHILTCKQCEMGINAWEDFAYVAFGALGAAKKGATGFQETADAVPEVVCMSCLNCINEECVELWPS